MRPAFGLVALGRMVGDEGGSMGENQEVKNPEKVEKVFWAR